MNLLNVLSKSLNFTYTLTHYEGNKPDSFGLLLNNIRNGTFNWGIAGLFVNVERIVYLDYPSIIFRDSYATAYPTDYINPSNNHQGHYIIKPFKLAIWLLLALAIGCFLIFYQLVEYFTKGPQRSFHMVNNLRFFRIFNGIFCNFQIPLRTLTDQSCTNKELQNMKFAIIFLLFWYFSQLISASYKSQLTSTSIQMRDPLPNTIRELYDAEYNFYVSFIIHHIAVFCFYRSLFCRC